MKTLETKTQFIELRAQGYSFEKISKKIGVSKQTLINWSKEFQEQINNLQNIHIDSLQEEYRISRHKRLELLGVFLDKVRTELEKRDMSKVSTKDLSKIYLSLLNIARTEEQKLSLKQISTNPQEQFYKNLSEIKEEWFA